MYPKTSIVVGAPAQEPVTLATAKAHLRIDHDEEDALIRGLIAAARMKLEEDTERSVTISTYPETCTLKLDEFPCSTIILPRCPVLGVTSIAYLDALGNSQTLSASQYIVDVASEPGRVSPAFGVSWPTAYDQINAVTITFTAGYGAALNPICLQAMLVIIAHWYENRGIVGPVGEMRDVPMTYMALMQTLRWGGYR